LFKIELQFLSDNRAFTCYLISKIPRASSKEVIFKAILDITVPA